MSEFDGEIRVDAEELLELVISVFERCGMSNVDAALLADSLVDADLCGTHSHGVMRVPEYVEKLTLKGVNPTAKPEVVGQGPSFVIVDGRNSMGQIGTALAMREVIGKAAQTGIAAGAIRGSNHCGAMAYFARMALPHDAIGIATTNALPTMASWGGAERILGINPLAFSVPAGKMAPNRVRRRVQRVFPRKNSALRTERDAPAQGMGTRPGRPADDRSQGGYRRPASPHRRVQRHRASDDHGRPFVYAFRR